MIPLSTGLSAPTRRDDAPPVLAAMAEAAGLRRIEIVAWRDLGHPEAGGSELHAERVAQRWAAAGIDVVLRTSRPEGGSRREVRDGYRVERLAGRYLVFPAVAATGAVRRRAAPDGVVEVWNGMPFFSPLWSDRPHAVILHHVHDGMWDMVLPRPLAALGRMVERRVAPPIYRRMPVVTLSESSRRTIISSLGLPPDNVRVVPPGVDDRFFPAGRRSPHPLVVAVGRLVPYKRFDLVIDVLVRLRAGVPGLQAVIAGDGSERHRLSTRIAELGATSWLELVGTVDDASLVDLYRRAWVITSMSAYEGWGLTITEAAACATPAVVSRIPGHVDAVREGVTGLLADDANELERGLASVLLDERRRLRLSSASVHRAAELSWDSTAYGTLQALASDSQRRHRGRP